MLGRLAALLVVLLAAGRGHAQAPTDEDVVVEVELESARAMVGIPVGLIVRVEGAGSIDVPDLPPMDGIDVAGPPSRQRSSFTEIVNGRMRSTERVQLVYALVPRVAGVLEVPSIGVIVDGRNYRSDPMKLVVRDLDDGGVVDVEILAEPSPAYVGQRLRITLRIRLAGYEDQSEGVVLGPEHLFARIDFGESSLGIFRELIRRDPFGRLDVPPSRRVRIAGPDGEIRTWHEWNLTTERWMTTAGPLEVEPVTLIVDYPAEVVRSNRQLQLRSIMVVGDRADASDVEILPPPADGRPEHFSGAVGRFEIDANVRPTEVAVGEPITLELIVRDRTPEGAHLELLQAPDLTAVRALDDDFQVPAERLTGTVAGRRKIFTQTIRARRSDVREVPPIPLAFFDPQAGRYGTVWTQPVPIEVESATMVGADDVVGAAPPPDAGPTELTEVAGGLMANVADPGRLLAEHGARPTLAHVAVAVGGPLLALAAGLVGRSRRRLAGEVGAVRKRRRGAAGRARRRLGEARRAGEAAEAATILRGYVADRLGRPTGSLTADEVLGRLASTALSDADRAEIRSVLREAEAARYAAVDEAASRSLLDRAGHCLDRLERVRW